MKRLSILFAALLLVNCSGTLPFHVQEGSDARFSPSKDILVETDPGIVDLSSRLETELKAAGFNVTDRREDAAYVLTFDYNARFDVYPWVFRSFSLTLSDSASGDIVYSIVSGKSRPEPVKSVMQRAARDMAERLLVHRTEPPETAEPALPGPDKAAGADAAGREDPPDLPGLEGPDVPQEPGREKPVTGVIDGTPSSGGIPVPEPADSAETGIEGPHTETADDREPPGGVPVQEPDKPLRPETDGMVSDTAVAEPPEPPSADISGGAGREYFIQVGAWKDAIRAREFLAELRKYYPEVYIAQHNDFHKIRIPGIKTRKQGMTIIGEIRRRFDLKPLLVVREK